MSDIYRPYAPKNPPVRCVKCFEANVILSEARHPDTGEMFWRFTCLDCRVAWPQDQHGGAPHEYE
ncbi:hypothetical protein ACFY12_24150 [Streptomyces sp. NPDC001339]|uniref:hypothetical protein n=1 Tax=Streptomyces sp. NPDC001339 TaxID=3364563 RepID=UPI0036AA1EB5